MTARVPTGEARVALVALVALARAYEEQARAARRDWRFGDGDVLDAKAAGVRDAARAACALAATRASA